MAKHSITLGNITVAIPMPEQVCNPPKMEHIEVEAIGISTVDGKQKTMALLVPAKEIKSPAALIAYVAENAFLVP